MCKVVLMVGQLVMVARMDLVEVEMEIKEQVGWAGLEAHLVGVVELQEQAEAVEGRAWGTLE
jgi:hypothetical protein